MTESIIDPLVFNEIVELMGDSMGEFIETYLDNSPKLIERMSTAIPAGDCDVVAHSAHQLKGGSGSIGAIQVFQLAMQLEEGSRDGKLDNLASIFEELKAAYEQVDAELRTHL